MALTASSLISLLALFCYTTLLLVVRWRDYQSRIYRSFSWYLLAMMVWSFGSFMIFAGFAFRDTLFWNRFMVAGSAAMPVTFFYFVQVFLRRERKRWVYLGYLAYTLTQLANLSGLIIKETHVQAGVLRNQYGMGVLLPSLLWIIFIGFSAFDLMREYRKTKDILYRNRLKYLFIVIMVIFTGSLTNATPLKIYPVDIAFNVISALLIAYAILRHQLLELNVVVRKSLLYAIPTTAISAGYFLIIFLAVNIFHAYSGAQLFLLSLGVAVVTALVAQPIHSQIQFWIDKQFFREKYDASQMLQRLSHTTADVIELNELTDLILAEVTGTIHIERAAFFLLNSESSDYELAAQRGLGPNLGFRFCRDHPLVQCLSGEHRAVSRSQLEVLPQFRALWRQEVLDLERLAGEHFLPLKAKEKLVGILVVGPKLSGETYSREDQQTLHTLAHQTAVAIENARLFDAERLRRREAEILREATAALTSALDVNQVLDDILVSLAQVVPYDSACVFLLIQEGNCLHATAGRGFPDPKLVVGQNYSTENELYQKIRSSGKPVILADASKDPLFQAWASTDFVRGWMGVPLMLRGEVIGILTLDNRKANSYNEAAAALAQAFANQAAIAIENARLFEAAYQQAEEADTLRQAAAAVTGTLQQEEAIERILEQLARVVPHDSASVQLLGEGFLEIVGGRGWSESASIAGLRFPVPGDNPNSVVIEQRRPYILGDAPQAHGTFREGPHSHIRSWMGIPLILQDHVIGMLALDSVHPDYFTVHHARLVAAFADQVAIVIENARLFAELRQRVEELATLFSTSTAMSAHIELQQVLTEITRQTTLALNGTSCYVSILDESGKNLRVVAEYFSQDAGPLERISDIESTYPLSQNERKQFESMRVQVTHLSDPQADSATLKGLQEYNGKTALSLPLVVRGQVLGELALWDSRIERTFGEAEIKLGLTIANQAAIALEQARLYAVERQRAKQLDALRATAADITAELELSKLLQMILARAVNLLAATGGDLGLYDARSEELEIVTSLNMGKDYTGTRMAMGEGVMGRVAQTRRALIINDYSSWEGRSPQYTGGPWRGAMASPLTIHGNLVGTIGVVHEDSERKFTVDDLNLLNLFAQQAAIAIENARLYAEVQRLAVTDPLTGLYNRRGLFEMGEREVERVRRFGHPLSAIMLDIDLFKEINDTYSHAVGDEVLRVLARRCQGNLRDVDILGRYGGEEFAILLPETDEQSAYQVAERLRRSLADTPIDTFRGPVYITISLGLTSVTRHSPDLAVLLDRADTAMYIAKRAGRNQVAATDPLHYTINMASPKE